MPPTRSASTATIPPATDAAPLIAHRLAIRASGSPWRASSARNGPPSASPAGRLLLPDGVHDRDNGVRQPSSRIARQLGRRRTAKFLRQQPQRDERLTLRQLQILHGAEQPQRRLIGRERLLQAAISAAQVGQRQLQPVLLEVQPHPAELRLGVPRGDLLGQHL